MTTTIQELVQPAIEYPDSDGEPMADNTLQFTWIVVIKEGLEALLRNDPGVFVAGDLLWYPVEGNPKIRSAPDAMVAFGRPKGRRGSYKQWVEGGVAPHVVFEVLSPGNRPGEMAGKFEFYETYGVEEYYAYDPDDGTLEGWLRVNERLIPIADMAGFVSPRLGIRFDPGEGPDNLTIVDPTGKPFLTYSELVEQLEAAERSADLQRQLLDAERKQKVAERKQKVAERKQKEAERKQKEIERKQKEFERQQKEAEHQRAERYAAKLRELGIEPD